MFDFVFAVFIIAAFIILFLATQAEDEFWALFYMIFDTVVWFFLAASSWEVETIYTMFNTSSGTIESGIAISTSKVGVSVFWLLVALDAICLVISIYMTFSMIKAALKPVLPKPKEPDQMEIIPEEDG
jgi:hypothetical protein